MTAEPVLGVLLAGGLARRMGGGDKPLQQLAGRPLLAHVIDRVQSQVATLLLNANGDPARFADYDLPIVADYAPGALGPLAGILTGMRWAQENRRKLNWILSIPTDAPFLPADLATRLQQTCINEKADLACARSDGRTHPVVGLWPIRLADDLEEALCVRQIYKIDRWTAAYRRAVVDWPVDPVDPFFNANRPDDLAAAAALLRQQ